MIIAPTAFCNLVETWWLQL